MRTHRGEISFPGGRMEEGEGPWETALREAHEEIALSPLDVERITELAPHTTMSFNSHITPVVGRIPSSLTFRPDPAEVARVLTVPLYELVRDDTYESETWTLADGEIDIHYFHLDDETVWGATARMLHGLIDVVTAD